MKKLQGLLVILLFASGTLLAQKKTISGKVTGQAGNDPLLGVNILANNQKGGTASKQDGTYSITVDSKTTTLIFSFVGYTTQTVVIGEKNIIDVILAPAIATGEEVVVIGYGTQKKSSVTGAVAKYTNDRLEETPNSRLDQALQGKIAGVRVQNISSEAGADPKVQVRGISSVSAGAEPLVVVDGHPLYEGLSFVNMADVASVEVLKDAASAAIYGSRGANGVIIVTTKSGKANKTKYSVKFSTGVKEAYELYPMMTTTEYTNLLFYEASLRLKDPSITTQPAILNSNERAAYIVESQIRGGVGTDWQREAIRNANVKNIQMNVSGGNSGVKYYISGGYQNDQGMMYHSEYERFTVKAKVDAQLSKKVKLSFNFNPSYIKKESPGATFTDFYRLQSFLPVTVDASIVDFIRQHPNGQYTNIQVGDFVHANMFNNRVYSGLMPDGSLWTTTSATSPFATANQSPKAIMENVSITNNDYRALTSGDISIEILPGLNFKSLASAFVRYSNGLDFGKTNSRSVTYPSTGVYRSQFFVDLLSENTISYNKRIKDHSFDFLTGFTAQKTKIRTEQTTATNYASDNITTLNTATVQTDPTQTFNETLSRGLLSGLARMIYGYKDKYLLNVSFRADGSSYFGTGNKWGYFPSASIGWLASKEKFFDNLSWLSSLKLRASYGATGNNNIGDYLFVDRLFSTNYAFGASTGTVLSGQSISRLILSNPDITWELTNQFNAGIDVALFKNAISFSLDVYRSKTDQLLLDQSTQAFAGVPNFINNIGKIQNDGIEFEITSNNIRKKDFRWSTTANISRTRNKVLEFGGEPFLFKNGERSEVYRNIVGQPLVQYYGFKTDGVWLSQADITASGISNSVNPAWLVPGALKIVDIDGNKILNDNDRTILGNPYPDFIWGITNNFTYKDFDLSFFFQGSQGGKVIGGDANYNETKRYNKNYNSDRWVSPAFPGDGKTPYSTLGINWMLTDYVVEDASFYALRELLVGYTLPEKFAKKAGLSSLRVYFSGQNLFYHKAASFRGLNPEARNTGGLYASTQIDGYQRGAFPVQKTLLFGIDFNF
ncbi:MAG TPA: TonB-dependent receptor [Chitinophagaceae bacterium]|nr:TonB-dependent receptor [Chitinophagaceae bacterium]MBP7107578.1 TonB-dependent receptor [Chitinophagaceae bacterium]MBP7315989.1 TonB-dependent receptor [Chitinophagaceae bacterium]HQV54913.1 TonB-dependent receptor [Chitinophagaceae bacterium]HQZ50998.1 TonB-dependent receptor [Chitinophagaceae bacterium]